MKNDFQASSMSENINQITSYTSQFKKIELNDRDWIMLILASENSSATYNCFGSLYLWGENSHQTIAKIGNRLLVYYDIPNNPFFAYPVGNGSLESAIGTMEQKSKMNGIQLILKGVTAIQKENLEREFPNYFDFTEERDKFDYFYDANKLANYIKSVIIAIVLNKIGQIGDLKI